MYYRGIDLKTFVVRRLRAFSLFNRIFPLGTGGSPEYSFRVWIKHLRKLQNNQIRSIPKIVAELGPGSSLGAGICALLSGAECYFAFDVQNYIIKEDLLKDFDALTNIFVSKNLNSHDFPHDILSDDILKDSLCVDRINLIRNDIKENGANGKYIRYFAPWNNEEVVENNKVDFIFSQCVLEHVDKLEDCYNTMHKWMKTDAYSSHLVDFQCHSFTKEWNGHWMFSEKEWQVIKGTDDWAINRFPSSKHLEFINKAGFSIIDFIRRYSSDDKGISRNKLNIEFSYLDDEDLKTTFIDILIKK
jgi:hypothetical protein